MAASGVKERAPEVKVAATFASAQQMREVLDRLLGELDRDPEVGPRIRATRVAQRFRFPDVGLVLNVTESDEPDRCLRWEFSDDVPWEPGISLEMDSAVANLYLQGQENLAIAIARHRISCHGRTRAALFFLPLSRSMIIRYRRIIERDYPQLLAP